MKLTTLTPEQLSDARAKYKAYCKRRTVPMPFETWLIFRQWGAKGGASCRGPLKVAAGRKGRAAQVAAMEAKA